MAETKEITSLCVVTDSETSYDNIGDIDGGHFDEKWLDNHIERHGADGLIKRIASMLLQVGNAELAILRRKAEQDYPVNAGSGIPSM